jgi:hypothetical protein
MLCPSSDDFPVLLTPREDDTKREHQFFERRPKKNIGAQSLAQTPKNPRFGLEATVDTTIAAGRSGMAL